RRVALALLRAYMHEDRAVRGLAHILEHRDELRQIVPVDDADIIEAELLEQRAAGDGAVGVILRARGIVLDEFRDPQPLRHLLAEVAQRHIGAAGEQTGEISRHGADRRRNRHLIVVEDDDQAPVHGSGIVERLIGHACGHGAIADDADHIVLAAGEIARHGHAESGRDRRRRMRSAEAVVFAFRALGEAGEAAALTQRANAIAPSGQDFVWVGLVAHIPDQLVVRRIEDIMQRDSELDNAETCAEMPSGHGDGVDRFGTKLVCNLLQVMRIDTAQIGRALDGIENWTLLCRIKDRMWWGHFLLAVWGMYYGGVKVPSKEMVISTVYR